MKCLPKVNALSDSVLHTALILMWSFIEVMIDELRIEGAFACSIHCNQLNV